MFIFCSCFFQSFKFLVYSSGSCNWFATSCWRCIEISQEVRHSTKWKWNLFFCISISLQHVLACMKAWQMRWIISNFLVSLSGRFLKLLQIPSWHSKCVLFDLNGGSKCSILFECVLSVHPCIAITTWPYSGYWLFWFFVILNEK